MAKLGAGLRRTSPESLQAQRYAEQYTLPQTKLISRNEALKIAKLAAAAMGLKSSKIALIDQLFACSKKSDWEANATPPIVWPSNSRLAQRMGIGISTMKHHLNGLIKAGLVAYRDGPTYQRRGRRDRDGNIVEATGIDLSPITVRFTELSEMVAAAEYEARECKRLAYRRTVLRKEIQSLILSAKDRHLDGPWDHAQARLEAIRERRAYGISELQDQVVDLEALQHEMEDIYDEINQDLNFNTAVSKFKPLQTTKDSSILESSIKNGDALSRDNINSQIASGRVAFEKKPKREAEAVQYQNSPSRQPGDDLEGLSLQLVRDTCPALTSCDPHIFNNWHTLRDSGHNLCVSSGINPQVWQEALEYLGRDIAIAALAVTIQKTDQGLVEKPGAYMRALVRKGCTGDLHISRSLYSMLKMRADALPSVDGARDTPREAKVFPESGSIAYGSWADVVRQHTPKPTPDVDIVAGRFRNWTRKTNLDLTSPHIERVFTSFCKKWRMN
ncbi:plasmid replication protein RepC [uncultured Roseibium sp.]|uniref:plasmid replication protein RepC n=1 Tax=uncultured Roseibium sp. TaxID=1936171 RepID=UPI0026375A24|nr:plasmid replication protein RepC [uncultured Roseibium sp.]